MSEFHYFRMQTRTGWSISWRILIVDTYADLLHWKCKCNIRCTVLKWIMLIYCSVINHWTNVESIIFQTMEIPFHHNYITIDRIKIYSSLTSGQIN